MYSFSHIINIRADLREILFFVVVQLGNDNNISCIKAVDLHFLLRERMKKKRQPFEISLANTHIFIFCLCV